MKKSCVVMLVVLALFAAGAAFAGDYRYVKQEQFRDWLKSGKRMVIIDIQVPAEFARRHFRGSIQTGAFPAKSEADRRKLDGAVQTAAGSADDIVIICPRGGGGAKNAYEYLKERGMAEKRLHILEKGMQGWPYQEL